MDLAPGQTAPDFTLVNQDESSHTLSAERGSWVLLYFYPKDDTPGCTAEACGMQDVLEKFHRLHCTVCGISADDTESHRKFAKKHGLSFPLLSDTDRKVVEAYGVWREKSFMGKKYMGIVRTSFLIDPQGIITKIYPSVSPEEHAAEVLRDLQTSQKG